MNWSENSKPKEGVSSYDHTILETPIGKMIIEWKSWEESPGYTLAINDIFVGTEYSLEAAKSMAYIYLTQKYHELGLFISKQYAM